MRRHITAALGSTTARIVWFALAIRLLTALLAFLLNAAVPLASRQQFSVGSRPHVFWDTFARFDSGWYFDIARYGYEWREEGRSNIAFFPAYPLLMRYVAIAIGGGRFRVYLAGILVSWLSFVLAMLVLHRLARIEIGDEHAFRAVAYAATFPFAFFFGIVYPESLFLLLTLLAFYGLRTRRWWIGALAGAAATATRPNGIFMLPALALVAWHQTRGDRGAQARAAIALVATAAGLGAYSLFIYSISGDPFEWAKTIGRWDWHPGTVAAWTPLWTVVSSMASDPYGFLTGSRANVPHTLNAAAAVSLLVSTPFVWRRLGFAYALLIVVNLYVPLSSGSLEGLGRYSAVLFPFSMWLATFRSPAVQWGLLSSFSMLHVLCLLLFTQLYGLF